MQGRTGITVPVARPIRASQDSESSRERYPAAWAAYKLGYEPQQCVWLSASTYRSPCGHDTQDSIPIFAFELTSAFSDVLAQFVPVPVESLAKSNEFNTDATAAMMLDGLSGDAALGRAVDQGREVLDSLQIQIGKLRRIAAAALVHHRWNLGDWWARTFQSICRPRSHPSFIRPME